MLTNPSCIDPPLASHGSSQLINTVKSIDAAYSREFLRTTVSCIASRAFETPTQPISRRALISAKTCPLRPSVNAPIQYILGVAIPRARSLINSTTAGVSMTGLVLGMQHILVNPPAAAALASLAIVALCSYPGSCKYEPKSINPGQTIWFVASITFLAIKPAGFLPVLIIFLPSIQTSEILSYFVEGLITRPFFIQIFTTVQTPP